MKIVCDRAALLDALAMAASVVPNRSPAPVMLCLKLSAADDVLSIQATDGELGLTVHVSSVQVDEPGEALLPADKLTQITRACDDSTLSISTERNVTTIKGQHATFRVFGYEPREFPGVRDAKDAGTEFEVAAGTLRRLIHRTAFATSVDNSRYAIAGTLLERKGRKLRMVATDGRRLAVARGDCSAPADGDSTCIVPAKSLSVLNRLLDDPDASVTVSRDRNRLSIQVGEAATLVSSLVEGTFPPFEDVIPKDHDKRATFDTGEFAAAIRRAALLTSEESKGVRLAFGPGMLRLSSRVPEMGEADIELPIAKYEGDPIEIGFNPVFITDVLKIADVPEVIVELKSPNKPGVVRLGQDFVYVVMPVNVG
jgi:DNA polymerase-3 subunit beta